MTSPKRRRAASGHRAPCRFAPPQPASRSRPQATHPQPSHRRTGDRERRDQQQECEKEKSSPHASGGLRDATARERGRYNPGETGRPPKRSRAFMLSPRGGGSGTLGTSAERSDLLALQPPGRTRVRKAPVLRLILPALMPKRNESIVDFERQLDLSKTLRWMGAENARRAGPIRLFRLVPAATPPPAPWTASASSSRTRRNRRASELIRRAPLDSTPLASARPVANPWWQQSAKERNARP